MFATGQHIRKDIFPIPCPGAGVRDHPGSPGQDCHGNFLQKSVPLAQSQPQAADQVSGKEEAILRSYKKLCLPTAPPGKIRLLDGGCWL